MTDSPSTSSPAKGASTPKQKRPTHSSSLTSSIPKALQTKNQRTKSIIKANASLTQFYDSDTLREHLLKGLKKGKKDVISYLAQEKTAAQWIDLIRARGNENHYELFFLFLSFFLCFLFYELFPLFLFFFFPSSVFFLSSNFLDIGPSSAMHCHWATLTVLSIPEQHLVFFFFSIRVLSFFCCIFLLFFVFLFIYFSFSFLLFSFIFFIICLFFLDPFFFS